MVVWDRKQAYCLMILDTGWQPRWFVLEGGSLSYFLSPNEVHLGSRGSLKVSSCDILGQSLAEMTFLQCIFLHDDISFSMVMEAMMNEFFWGLAASCHCYPMGLWAYRHLLFVLVSTVHSTDHKRMDMVMPGGRHIYLRAASMLERQQWLLALGVAKQQGGSLDADSAGLRPSVCRFCNDVLVCV